MLGVLPLATAAAGFIFSRERPSIGFWFAAVIGTAIVVVFSLLRGRGAISPADLALLGAVGSASIGYAEGARLSRSLGSLQVISWALVLMAPVLFIPMVLCAPTTLHLPSSAWLGFIYVSLISQFLGFLPWYRGLALGGIARVGQIQLLQPFFTIAAASILLGETVDWVTVTFALGVFAIVAIGSKMRIEPKSRDSVKY